MTSTRTPEEIFAHHGSAFGAENLDEIVSDYADDAILIVHGTVYRGQHGVREAFTEMLHDLPQASLELETVFVDDVLYLEWKAQSANCRVDDGIDTFVFHDGKIRVQTVHYTAS